MKLPSLQQVMCYENPVITHYFLFKHPTYSIEQSQQLFKDLLAWLWLNAWRKSNNKQSYLFGPLLNMDEMWHLFILHTRDYLDFCQQFYGEYFHHDIEPPGFEHELDTEELADYLHDCYELLGEDWVNRYFSEAFKN